MTNSHFLRYTQWKQSSLLLIALLLIALTITHGYYYYILYRTSPKVASDCLQEPQITQSNEQLFTIIQDINKQELYTIFNALLEIMPTDVKMEKLEYNSPEMIITLRSQHHKGMVKILEACSTHTILKRFCLKKSFQENNEIVFILG
ncbi:MAG: hypothetical protein K2X90_01405 [Candidatus Babeliaceae bacterium]|nr:hypothetical protein [Candidatus Babeliaceae bacterium]